MNLQALIPFAFLALIVVLLFGIAHMARHLYRGHASPEGLRKRQLLDAQRGQLLHQLAAEQHAAAADGYARTVARLQGTALVPMANVRVMNVIHGGGGGGAGGVGTVHPVTSAPPEPDDIDPATQTR